MKGGYAWVGAGSMYKNLNTCSIPCELETKRQILLGKSELEKNILVSPIL